jgi:hypothetical protein
MQRWAGAEEEWSKYYWGLKDLEEIIRQIEAAEDSKMFTIFTAPTRKVEESQITKAEYLADLYARREQGLTEKESASRERDNAEEEYTRLWRSNIVRKRAAIATAGVGLSFSVIGFILWFSRIQRFADITAELEGLKAQRELDQLKEQIAREEKEKKAALASPPASAEPAIAASPPPTT